MVTVWLGRLCVLLTPLRLALFILEGPSAASVDAIGGKEDTVEGHSMSDMVGCRKLNVSDMQFSRLIRTPALGHCQSTSMSDM